MKYSFNFFLGTFALLLASATSEIKAQGCGCEFALTKDRIESSDEGFEYLYYLNQIDEAQFEKIKKSADGSYKYKLIKASGNVTELRENVRNEIHKTELATGRQFKSSNFEARTNAIAYEHWSRCMETCNDKIGLLLWIQNESENSLALILKYRPAPNNNATINYTVTIQHGDGSIETQKGTIVPNGSEPITIKRKCGTTCEISQTNISVKGAGYSTNWVVSRFFCGNRITKTIALTENQNCNYGDCYGIKSIEKIEILSFVLEERLNSRSDCNGWESHGEELNAPEQIEKLKFGSWYNPDCKDAAKGKWSGTGWHFPSGSCCREPATNGFAAVRKVTVRIGFVA